MNWDKILSYINKKMGRTPRRFNILDKWSWFKQDKPDWLWQNDDIRISVNNWEKVFTHGKITWGHIIQANRLMFQQSTANCPGEILIWHEKTKAFDPDSFSLVAEKLYELKGYSKFLDEPDEKEFANYLEDEHIRTYGMRVPESISDNLDLRVSTIFFQRRHIPDGVVKRSLFPILYLEDDPMVIVMVPYKFWPKEFLSHW